MNQGQAMERLNFFAFGFLPLAWVAVSLGLFAILNAYFDEAINRQSIFGMTQFYISAVWYPLWALVALLVVFLISRSLRVHGFIWSMRGFCILSWLKGIFLKSVKVARRSSKVSFPKDSLGSEV